MHILIFSVFKASHARNVHKFLLLSDTLLLQRCQRGPKFEKTKSMLRKLRFIKSKWRQFMSHGFAHFKICRLLKSFAWESSATINLLVCFSKYGKGRLIRWYMKWSHWCLKMSGLLSGEKKPLTKHALTFPRNIVIEGSSADETLLIQTMIEKSKRLIWKEPSLFIEKVHTKMNILTNSSYRASCPITQTH